MKAPMRWGSSPRWNTLWVRVKTPPQAYNGVFSLPNVLRQCEQPHEVGGVRDPRVNKALDDDLQPLGTGNPKTLFYTITA